MNEDEFNHLLQDLTQRVQHLSEEELNSLLEALIQRVQQQRPGALERQQAMSWLVRALQQSPWFKRQRPRVRRFPDRYDQIHNEALSFFWERVCREIDRFQAGRTQAALRWISFLLDKCVADAAPAILGNPKLQVRSLDNLESYLADPPQPMQSPSTLELVDAYIAEDPDGHFQKHVQGFPQATFQTIYQWRREGRSLKQIADQLGISNEQTVHSFYSRQQKRLKSYIRNYVQEHSYL